jgi:putative transcriptional regulator
VPLDPTAGRLLVAAPSLIESTFTRTVVYLLEHDGGGTVGVVINRPTRTPVGEVLPDWHDIVSEPAVVFGGGPVLPDGALCMGTVRNDPVVLAAEPDVRLVAGDIGTVDLEADVAVIDALTTRLRVFAGHAGWAPSQLEEEIEEGSWFVVESQPDDIFCSAPKRLWRDVLRRQPPPLTFVSTFPAEVGLN